jgi:hypothetical protein
METVFFALPVPEKCPGNFGELTGLSKIEGVVLAKYQYYLSMLKLLSGLLRFNYENINLKSIIT